MKIIDEELENYRKEYIKKRMRFYRCFPQEIKDAMKRHIIIDSHKIKSVKQSDN